MLTVQEPPLPGAVMDLCANDAIHVLDVADLDPGVCFLTRTSVGPFIDTLLDVDELPDHGRLYIAASLITGLASEHFGMVPGTEADRLRDAERALRDQMERKDALIDDLRKTVNGFRAADYKPRTRRTPAQMAEDAKNGVHPDEEKE